jgi:hypothetical protein
LIAGYKGHADRAGIAGQHGANALGNGQAQRREPARQRPQPTVSRLRRCRARRSEGETDRADALEVYVALEIEGSRRERGRDWAQPRGRANPLSQSIRRKTRCYPQAHPMRCRLQCDSGDRHVIKIKPIAVRLQIGLADPTFNARSADFSREERRRHDGDAQLCRGKAQES